MKYAVVTGGTRGIGKQIVCDLLHRGYFVFTNYASNDIGAKNALIEFQKISSNIIIQKADQSNEDFLVFIEMIKQKASLISCLVLNTGCTLRKDPEVISNADWEGVLNVNLNSHFYLIRDLKSQMATGGRIIFIGSLLGNVPHSTSLAYGVAKSAVHALAKNLVKYFNHSAITVNIIAPGFVDTDWQTDKPIEIRQNILRKTAIERFSTVQEISNTCLFLIDNGYINGATIAVDGGYDYK